MNSGAYSSRGAVAAISVRAAVVLLALGAGLSFLGAWSWLFDLLSHFRVYFAAVAAVLLAAALLVREKPGAVIAALVVAANVIPVAPYVSFASAPSDRGGFRVVVMNLLDENRETDRAVAFLRRVEADAVFLLEAVPHWTRSLDALNGVYPHRFDNNACPKAGHCFMTLLAKRPWLSIEAKATDPDAPLTIRAEFPSPAGTLTVLGTHLYYPLGEDRSAIQSRQLDALVGMIADIPGPIVLAGDFNFTPWSRLYRRLTQETGLNRAGGGILGTWTSRGFPVRFPIDHVFSRPPIQAVHARLGPEIGSDHLPLIADIVFQ